MIKIYLASAFDQRWWVRIAESMLEAEGFEVLSTWQWIDEGAEATPDQERAWAEVNLEAIHHADLVVLFVYGHSAGGRWTEMGFALAEGKPVLVVGETDNVFCRLPQVQVVSEREWGPELLALAHRLAHRQSPTKVG